jgi:mono/diheme cytochrome c family protein
MELSMNLYKRSFLSAILIAILLISRVAVAQIPLPENPTKGARLFVSKGCVRCHALKGEGGKGGPDLGKIDLGNTQLELASRLLNHIPSMMQGIERARFGKTHLTGEELTEISAYLYFFKFFDDPGNATRGKYLFNEKGCNQCHPVSGTGKEGEPGLDQFPQNITPVFLSQAIWNHGPVMVASMVKVGMKWATFEGTEMMDLLEYIKANAKGPREMAFITPGNPREGRRLFATKGCIKCHTIRGEGGKGGEDLGKRAKVFYTSLTQIASLLWNKGPTVLAKMAQTQTGIPRFTAKEMADIVSYLYFLHFIDEPGNVVSGKKVYTKLGCARCHGLDTKPGEMNIDLSQYQKVVNLMDIVAGIWNHGNEIEKAMKEKGIPWPRFKKGELADLLEFIHSAKK